MAAADVEVELNKRAGFTDTLKSIPIRQEDGTNVQVQLGFGDPHFQVKSWYAGTVDTSLASFPEGSFEWLPLLGEVGVEKIHRTPVDDSLDELKLKPWYGEHSEDAPQDEQLGVEHRVPPNEGIQHGWYFSVLGGGVDQREDSNEPQTKVTEETNRYPGVADSQNDPPVPMVFNGGFDVSHRPRFGRFPVGIAIDKETIINALETVIDAIKDQADDRGVLEGLEGAAEKVNGFLKLFSDEFEIPTSSEDLAKLFVDQLPIDDNGTLVEFGPSWQEIPGWSLHGGSGGKTQGDQLVELYDDDSVLDWLLKLGDNISKLNDKIKRSYRRYLADHSGRL